MTKLLKISDKCITAPKYNGGQLYIEAKKEQKKPIIKVEKTVCLDWFEVTISASKSSFHSSLLFSSNPTPSFSEGDFTYVHKGRGSKYYKFSYTVYLNGEKFGNILTSPRSDAILDLNYCQFKLENHKLYQSSWVNDFEYFMDSLGFSIVSYSRVDIAVDGSGILDSLGLFLDKEVQRLGTVKYNTYHEKVDGVDRVVTGVDWGSKSSDKYMTIYRKSKRIEVENKQYISRFWDRSGLDTSKGDIDRMELKMKSKCISKIPSFDYKKLDSASYLASVFRTQMKGYFEFVYPSSDSNKSRWKRYEFIDYESMGGVLLEKDSTSPSSEVWSIKLAVKTMFHQGYKGVLELDVCLEQINILISWYGLNEWYLTRSKAWKRKFVKDSLIGVRSTG